MSPDVSIVIVNYHTEKLICNLVNSISDFTQDVTYEVIIVDNGSGDQKSLERLTLAYNVRLKRNDVNVGFGCANNIGIKIARGEYICLLNPDTILRNDAISLSLDFLKNSPIDRVGCVGAVLEDLAGKAIFSYGKFSSFWWDIFYYHAYALKKVLNIKRSILKSKFCEVSDFLKVDYVSGAFLVFHKSVFFDVGCFDEDFFMYSEEVDLQLRMRKANYSRIIISSPRVVHLEGKSFKISNVRRTMMTVSRLRYIKKHSGRIAYYFSKSNYILSLIISSGADLYFKEYTLSENLRHLRSVFSNDYR